MDYREMKYNYGNKLDGRCFMISNYIDKNYWFMNEEDKKELLQEGLLYDIQYNNPVIGMKKYLHAKCFGNMNISNSDKLGRIRGESKERKEFYESQGYSDSEVKELVRKDLESKDFFVSKGLKNKYAYIWETVIWNMCTNKKMTINYEDFADEELDGSFEFNIPDTRPTPEEITTAKDTVAYIKSKVEEIDNELIRCIYIEYMECILDNEKPNIAKIARKYGISRQYADKVIKDVNKQLRELLKD